MVAFAELKIRVTGGSGSVGVRGRDLNTKVLKKIVNLDRGPHVALPASNYDRRFVKRHGRNDQARFAKEDVQEAGSFGLMKNHGHKC